MQKRSVLRQPRWVGGDRVPVARRRRRFLQAAIAVGILSAFGLLTAATAARAQLPTPPPVPVDGGRLVDVPANAVGQVQSTVERVVCNLTAKTELAPVTCNLGALGYSWFTRFKRPNGVEVTREVVGLVNVPSLLDVDDDLSPDIVANIKLVSLNELSVEIDRVSGENAVLPISVEAIVTDPTQGGLRRERINFGYDARDGRAPATFKSTFRISSIVQIADGVTVTMNNTVTGAGTALSVVGGMFDGTPAARRDPVAATLRYSDPVPATFGSEVTLGKSLSATLAATSQSVVDLDAVIDEGTSRIHGRGRLVKAPQSMKVTLDQQGADQRTVTYIASQPIAELTASYESGTVVEETLQPAQVARVRATVLPTRMTVVQTGPAAATFSAHDSRIGSLEFAVANGEPHVPTHEDHYFSAVDRGGVRSLAARIVGLRSAAASLGSISTVGAAFDHRPLHLQFEDAQYSVAGVIESLPAEAQVTLDMVTGALEYKASDPIDLIDVTARRVDGQALLGRATQARIRIKDIPAEMRLTFAPDGDRYALITDKAIDSIEFALSSGALEFPAGNEHGVLYRDHPDRGFAFSARVRQLQSLTFTGGNHNVVTTKIGSGPFIADVDVALGSIHAELRNIPGEMTFELDNAQRTYKYSASKKIDMITVDLDAASPLVLTADRARVVLTDVPALMTLQLAPDGEGASIKMLTDAPGEIYAGLSSDEEFIEIAKGVAAAHANVTPTASDFALRALMPKRLSFVPQPLRIDVVSGGQQVLELNATLQLAATDKVTTVTGTVNSLPSAWSVSQTATTVDDAIVFSAAESITKIELGATNLPGGMADTAAIDVNGVEGVTVSIGKADGRVAFTTEGDGVDLISIEFVKGARRFSTSSPSGNEIRAEVVGTDLHAFARLLNVFKGEFSPKRNGNSAATTVGDFEFSQDPAALSLELLMNDGAGSQVEADLFIKDPPRKMTLTQFHDGADAHYRFDSSESIPEVSVFLVMVGQVVVDAQIKNIPGIMDVCFADFGYCSKSTWHKALQQIGFWFDVSDDSPQLVVNGRVCLGSSGTNNLNDCRNSPGQFVDVTNLRFTDVAFVFGGGIVTSGNCDGGVPTCADRDNVLLLADTEPVSVDRMLYWDGTSSGIFLRGPNNSIRANDFGALIDTTSDVLAGEIPGLHQQRGSIECEGSGFDAFGPVSSVSNGGESVQYQEFKDILNVLCYPDATAQYQTAFQANTNQLITFGAAAKMNTGQGMMPGTSPSIATLSTGGQQMAFQSNTGELILWGAAGNFPTRIGMMAGTSPSIAASPHGGFRVAVQANTGELWVYDSTHGPVPQGQGMMAGTSPSITPLRDIEFFGQTIRQHGYQMAFQANTGVMIVFGDRERLNTGQGMLPGTSPSIDTSAAGDGGYRVAFQANTGQLFLWGPDIGPINTGAPMAIDTSPSITDLTTQTGYEVAYQNHAGRLSLYGDAATWNTTRVMRPGTSPSIVGGGKCPPNERCRYRVAYQGDDSLLRVYNADNGTVANFGQGMAPGTSPDLVFTFVTG